MTTSVGVLDHYNLRTHKFKETVTFYESVLGLENGPRPNFSFPGAWMYSEGKPVVHLVDISGTNEPHKPDSGVVHHIAFVSSGFSGMQERLSKGGFEFRTQAVPGNELCQIFLTDPNGVVIELNYDVAKEQAQAA